MITCARKPLPWIVTVVANSCDTNTGEISVTVACSKYVNVILVMPSFQSTPLLVTSTVTTSPADAAGVIHDTDVADRHVPLTVVPIGPPNRHANDGVFMKHDVDANTSTTSLPASMPLVGAMEESITGAIHSHSTCDVDQSIKFTEISIAAVVPAIPDGDVTMIDVDTGVATFIASEMAPDEPNR